MTITTTKKRRLAEDWTKHVIPGMVKEGKIVMVRMKCKSLTKKINLLFIVRRRTRT